jgi:hypothetical protein
MVGILHLDGMAAEWYYALEQDYGMVTWTCFTEFVNSSTFTSTLQFDQTLSDELKELHHTRTVEEYQRKFLMLLCRCEGLSPDWASQCALMMRFSDPRTSRQPSSWQECLNAAQVWQPSRLQVQAPIPSTVHGPPCQEPQSATWRPQPVRRSPCFSAYNP